MSKLNINLTYRDRIMEALWRIDRHDYCSHFCRFRVVARLPLTDWLAFPTEGISLIDPWGLPLLSPRIGVRQALN